MRLDEVIRGIAITDRRGRFDSEVTSITADSRTASAGSLFVAVRGLQQDGHRYIRQAVENGARAVLAEHWPDNVDSEDVRPSVVLVPNSRRALALAAANYYGQPSRKLLVAGVTGTNGKTTVTYVLESIIRAASKKVGVIGTVECRYAGRREPLEHTTPDAVLLEDQMAKMVDHGVTHLAMEVSSHALDQQRVAGLHFKVAGFTNLSQDHLDYHKTFDAYFEAKARLFSEFLRKSRARGRMAVVNVDDPYGEKILERWGGKALRVSLDPDSDADIVALNAKFGLVKTEATVRTSKGVWDIETSLIGRHNLSNVLIGMGMALAMGFSKARIIRGLRALERVPGRLELVPSEDGKMVFVDYAHTPDALEKTLHAVKALTEGRLIVVFGCGGDRDKEKRPLMGKAVAGRADLAIITNDNPRREAPAQIAAAVETGLQEGGFSQADGAVQAKQYTIELDRRAAIRKAVEWIRDGDVLIIAGKGHEDYQIIGAKKHRFDDREETRRILAGLPPPPPMVFEDVPTEGTTEVEVDQVVQALELIEEKPAPQPMPVEADAIVEAVDLEPEIVGEEPAPPEASTGASAAMAVEMVADVSPSSATGTAASTDSSGVSADSSDGASTGSSDGSTDAGDVSTGTGDASTGTGEGEDPPKDGQS